MALYPGHSTYRGPGQSGDGRGIISGTQCSLTQLDDGPTLKDIEV